MGGGGQKESWDVRQAIRKSRKTNDYQMLFLLHFLSVLFSFFFVGKSQLKVAAAVWIYVTGYMQLLY